MILRMFHIMRERTMLNIFYYLLRLHDWVLKELIHHL